MVHQPQRRTPGPDDVRALLAEALSLHQAGRLAEAEDLYRRVLAIDPRQFDARHLLGLVHFQRGDCVEAVRHFDLALAATPDAAIAHNSRAAALNGLKRYDEAVGSCDNALASKPDYAEALINRGFALVELKRFAEALANCDQAIALRPNLPEAFNNRGNALRELDRLDEALESYDRAIALRLDYAEAFNNRANALNQQRRFGEALENARRAIALKPTLAQAHSNHGIALHELRRYEEALASYDAAIAHSPDHAEALVNRATLLIDLRRHDEACAGYAQALARDPRQKYVKGMHLHARQLICDWTDFEMERAALNREVGEGALASLPLQLLACSSDPQVQLTCAQSFMRDKIAASFVPLWRGERYSHPRIRIAYLSSVFNDHPVMMLAAGLFEHHDRSRFETIAVSSGPATRSAMRLRLEAAFDRFIDVRELGDLKVARLIRELEIDIAVDLDGITDTPRPTLFARRPAPVQVNYLGYAGTMGASYWDYILADRYVIPREFRHAFVEQVVELPDSFMVNDGRREISERAFSRAEAGLPENGIVFCCFNSAHKITPEIFDVWMRLLAQIDGSVLWLSSLHAAGTTNLRRAAQARGVAADRLVFASRVARNEDHLARVRLADLFVDTLHYNAHMTAADALWAGVPVLTCSGATFASRVAGSLLGAVGLPELITTSLADYETLALRLARDPALLLALRQKLARNRATFPLFDTARFTRHVEAAYTTMWKKSRCGEPPCGFAVAPMP
jgi:protein O-GlcNAc transferase